MSISPNDHLPGAVLESICVLLVEDSDDDAYFFSRVLRRSGEPHEYRHFQDGKSILRFLSEEAASGGRPTPCGYLMFLDLKMPVLNGFDVLTWMQKHPLPQPLCVCVLSGSGDERDRKRAKELGATGYVVKPISLSDLQQRMREFRQALSPARVASAAEEKEIEP